MSTQLCLDLPISYTFTVFPDGCNYKPKHSDECLSRMWLDVIECIEMGEAYPPSMNESLKEKIFGKADLHRVMEIMGMNASDQMQCYGFSEFLFESQLLKCYFYVHILISLGNLKLEYT